MAAVDRGAVATGIINSYYWARLHTEQGAAKTHAQIYHFGHGDVGALVNISGAAILASSKNKDAAQNFWHSSSPSRRRRCSPSPTSISNTRWRRESRSIR